MPKAPRKNISKTLDDIRGLKKRKKSKLSARRQFFRVAAWPLYKDYLTPKTDPQKHHKLIQVKQPVTQKKKKKSGNSSFKYAVIIFLVLATNVYIFNLLNFKDMVSGKISVIYEELIRGKNAITQLNPEVAENAFLSAKQELSIIQKRAKISGFNFIPILKDVPEIIGSISDFNKASLLISQDINYLKNNGLNLALNNGGEQLIKTLENLHDNTENLIFLNAEIQNQSSKLKNLSPKIASFVDTFNNEYLNISVNLYKIKEWIGSFLALLKSPQEQHLLLIFQNPSEMRPAGGFIGSYGVITLDEGNIKNIVIDDIYNADRQLDLKLIPPKQLQSLTKDWGARDANWFFNFPTSARKVIYLLENSDLYKEKSIRFLGLTAINVGVMESLLEAIGPIEVPDYQLTLTEENFLQEIQYEVEAGRDKKPGQNPKKILSVIAPLILEKLTNLQEGEKNLIFKNLLQHFQNKDILFYFKNFSLENLATEMGLAGEILNLPANFSGDYLAVVNSNIAGGKTDAFINQKIVLESEIKNDGSIDNHLIIERRHNGQNETEWWYKTENKNFIKILAPQNSRLKEITGNYYKSIRPLINYTKADYEYDLDLKEIENSTFSERLQAEIGQELNKAYFATWLNVKAGATKKLELNYDSPHQIAVQNGTIYKFIFEKQSGVNGSLEYSVSAPLGYIFQETNKEVFEYYTQNPKAREIIELTLVKP